MEIMWDIYPILRLGPLQVRYYSLFFIAVFLGGWGLYRWQVMRAGGTENDANWMLVIGVSTTWLGGRFAHLLFYETERFLSEPGVFFNISEGGLASHGAWIAMSMALMIFARLRGQSFIEMCDRMSFTSAYGAFLIRLGNLFNSEIVGRATNQEWGFRFPRYEQRIDSLTDSSRMHEVLLRHPVQLYEAFYALAVLSILLIVDRRLGEERYRGLMCSLFVSLYFGGRFFIEYFKEFEGVESGSVLTMGQWLSIPSFLVGLLGLVLTYRYRMKAKWESFGMKPENQL